ncbi:MAG TPA: HNH endonuclease, partial [Chloroflexota bacterium]|nr:HNH endonuclease [Chloroflexota bacterium]
MMSQRRVVDIIRAAADAIISRDSEASRAWLESIDEAALSAERQRLRAAARATAIASKKGAPATDRTVVQLAGSRNLSESLRAQAFFRDGFVCRLSHCRRLTIVPPVLRLLDAAHHDILRYDPNWNGTHDLFWLYMASGEHVRPWSLGGSSDVGENVATTCYWCNQLKSARENQGLGW